MQTDLFSYPDTDRHGVVAKARHPTSNFGWQSRKGHLLHVVEMPEKPRQAIYSADNRAVG